MPADVNEFVDTTVIAAAKVLKAQGVYAPGPA
jgi:hypothetical protein